MTSRLARAFGAVALVAGLVRAVALSAAGPLPLLSASPNPVGPGRLSAGTTVITWHTPDHEDGRVFVSANGDPETLFAAGASGSQPAPWIATGSTYEFRLYREQPRHELLASVVVTRRDDAFLAGEWSAAACAGLAVLIGVGLSRPRAAWFLEIGPLAVALCATWVALASVAVSLRPVWGYAPDERRALGGTLALLLLIWATLLLFGRRTRIVATIAVTFVLATLGFADIVHARFYDDVMTVTELSAAPQLRFVGPTLGALVKPADGVYYGGCLLLVVFAPFYLRLSKRVPPIPVATRRWCAAGAAVAGILMAVPTVRLMWRERPEMRFSRRAAVAEMGVLPFHVYDTARAGLESVARRFAATDADRVEVQRMVATIRSGSVATSPLFGVARGRNLILINAESLNAFPIGLTIGGVPVMPHLEALARESLQFTSFYDETGLGTTSDAEWLALESLYPLSDGPVATRFATNDLMGLPAILAREQSYHTLSAVAATAETWNVGQMHPRHGFQRSYFGSDFIQTRKINGWLADEPFFSQMAPRLAGQPQPFMAFLMTASSHFPYTLPPDLRTLAVGDLEGTMLGHYLQAVHYFDGALGAFIDELRASGVLDQTVFAMYGDHHAFLDDPAAVARLTGAAPGDAMAEWRTRKHVPFLVRLPHGEAAGVRTVTGGHLDIAPTLLALLGVDVSGTAMLGRDLTAGVDQLVVFRDGGFADGHAFFLTTSGASPLCYDTDERRVSCDTLATQRRTAVERLRVSDLIIRGNLVPAVLNRPNR